MNNTHSGIVMRRWTEQRWLLDNIIRSVGIDWDQPRTITYNTPCGPEANADFAGIRERVKKYADISPAFEAAARRREAKARAAETSAPRQPAAKPDLAIPDYDGLSASQVVTRLGGLAPDELEAVRRHEAANRGRKTILNKVAQLQV